MHVVLPGQPDNSLAFLCFHWTAARSVLHRSIVPPVILPDNTLFTPLSVSLSLVVLLCGPGQATTTTMMSENLLVSKVAMALG